MMRINTRLVFAGLEHGIVSMRPLLLWGDRLPRPEPGKSAAEASPSGGSNHHGRCRPTRFGRSSPVLPPPKSRSSEAIRRGYGSGHHLRFCHAVPSMINQEAACDSGVFGITAETIDPRQSG